MTSLLAEAKSALGRLNLYPRKKWGQNFMIDAAVLQAIADAVVPEAAAIGNDCACLIEIGPGLGFLTRYLLGKNIPVVAIEKDPKMAEYLGQNIKSPNLTVMVKDILELDLGKDLGPPKPVKVAGNIPYNITSPILEWLIGQRRLVRSAFLTVQKEVAARVTACPGTKAWGALSVFLQFYSNASVLRDIPPGCFYPSPNVDSALLKLEFLDAGRVKLHSEEHFFRIVRKAFQKRRKTIANALADETSETFAKKSLMECLNKSGIDPGRRPETLSIGEWALLSDNLFPTG